MQNLKFYIDNLIIVIKIQVNNLCFYFIIINKKKKQIFHKRKLSHHFDRSKYFKNQSLLQQPQYHHINSFIRRQKTQYRSNNSNLNKQKLIQSKIKSNQPIIDDIVPIIKQRTNKPKTAGGFLKKYTAQGVCIRPDFELHLNQQDIF